MTKAFPEPGRLVFVRQRRYLVENVTAPSSSGEATLVELSCLDDDAQGEPLSVLWEHELDARVLQDDGWSSVAEKGFDDPALFAAYLRTLSWNCVTATDPNLFQAPFRAGIRIDAYQLEPLRKALRLPRVNLFIADDVGLGKTIEAGLIARELLLRRRIDRIVVACPPSMLDQWRDEMEARFGLVFTILDREHVTRMRRERGFSVNPWTTHSRFLVSHRLLIDEAYASGLRDWLGEFAPQSLLILDEAHNAAPSSGARYAIDSQITRTIRDLAPRFEHRLFLSATPHNGHSNSFAALLEILDPQRFCRGVRVLKGQLDEILVRRLKSDIRALEGGFPQRTVVQIDIDGLPVDAPELVLASRLDAYRVEREKRLANETRSRQAVGALVIGGLQKRLLSSIEAFAKTLAVHRKSVERAIQEARAAEDVSKLALADLERMTIDTDSEAVIPEALDDDSDISVDNDAPDSREQLDLVERELDEQMEKATAASTDASQSEKREALEHELALVDEMREIAEVSRYAPDPRVNKIVDWIDENMCPGLRARGIHRQTGMTAVSLSLLSTRIRAGISSAASPKRLHTPIEQRSGSRPLPASLRGRSGRRSSTPSTPSRETIRYVFLLQRTRREKVLTSSAIAAICSTSIYRGIRAVLISVTVASTANCNPPTRCSATISSMCSDPKIAFSRSWSKRQNKSEKNSAASPRYLKDV